MRDRHDALKAGTALEGHQIERVLGAGGFGITYLARDMALSRLVAIKEFFPAGIACRGADQDVRPFDDHKRESFVWGLDRFRDEARTLVQFRHPNIVAVLRLFDANQTAHLVMDYIEGDSLGTILRRTENFPENEIKKVLYPLLDGLAAVHAAGFLHRDIKPENIFVRKDNGQPVLIDFGAARRSHANHTLTAIYSPGYTPIEQYGQGGEQGPWTDLYALGATLYRCVTGEHPPEATSRVSAAARKRPDPMIPMQEAAKGSYSTTLLSAIEASLAVFENDRPQSIAEFRALLETDAAATTRLSKTEPTAFGSETTLVAGAPSETSHPRVGKVFRDHLLAPEMVILPPGRYSMGVTRRWTHPYTSEEGYQENEDPQHYVSISYFLAVGKYPVTNAEWDAFVAATSYQLRDVWSAEKAARRSDKPRCPVTEVTWEDAQQYIAWLRELTGQPYRLLSEAEWEYACRAGSKSPFWTGDEISSDQANYYDEAAHKQGRPERTTPVDTFPPNPFGLHDMHGNVWELVEDVWHDNYWGAPSDGSAWVTGGDNSKRITRGGAYLNPDPDFLRSSYRCPLELDHQNTDCVGFRVARTVQVLRPPSFKEPNAFRERK